MYSFKLRIDKLPERFNQRQGASWKSRHMNSKMWFHLVGMAMKTNNIYCPDSPLTKAKLKFIRHSSVEPDFDGLVQSFKPVVDALKKCGVIEDDRMSVIGQPSYEWFVTSPKKGFIEIQVEEI